MIVVTTPTGTIGSQVLENLIDNGETVRVVVRDPDRIPSMFREQVDIIQGSHRDREVVERAFQDADSVFWLVPPDVRSNNAEAAYVEFSRAACELFRTGQIKRVVVVSALGRGWPFNAGLVSASLAMVDLINSTGIHSRVLAMPSFMDNLLRQVPSIRAHGIFFTPIDPELKLPMCSTFDIAIVATELLLDRTWLGQREVPILGPEDLSFNDISRIISCVIGKPVRCQRLSMDAFYARMISAGTSRAMARAYGAMMVAKNEGIDNMVVRNSQSASPTSFQQWCEEILKPAVLE